MTADELARSHFSLIPERVYDRAAAQRALDDAGRVVHVIETLDS